MPPTDHLVRLSDGTMCAAWGYAFVNGHMYYNLLSHYEDAKHFRHAGDKDNRDLEDGKIKYQSGDEWTKDNPTKTRGIISCSDMKAKRDSMFKH